MTKFCFSFKVFSIITINIGSAKYLFFFFGKCFKKNYWIFSQIFFYLKVQSCQLKIENNFIQMAASTAIWNSFVWNTTLFKCLPQHLWVERIQNVLAWVIMTLRNAMVYSLLTYIRDLRTLYKKTLIPVELNHTISIISSHI